MDRSLKSIIPLLLVLVLGFLHPSATSASKPETPIQIVINGNFIESDASPVILESHLLVPLRALSSLGLSYEWHPSTGKVRMYNHFKGFFLEITKNSKTAVVDEQNVHMNIPAQVYNGRMMVPLRFVSEALDYTVQYENIRKMVFIHSADYTFDSDLINQSDLQAARKAAIALPISADFDPIGLPVNPNHSYTFHAGRADMYMFTDQYTNSYVEIHEGKAKLIGQFVSGVRSEFSHASGKLKTDSHADPLITQYYSAPFAGNPVTFYTLGDGTAQAGYKENGEDVTFSSPLTSYPDIIQKLPDQY